MQRPGAGRIISLFFHRVVPLESVCVSLPLPAQHGRVVVGGEFHRWKWKLNFLRWAAGLTTDVRENASAHGDNQSPLKDC